MKNVLVTGCSSGIGKAIVKYLIEKGFFVFGSVRKASDAQQLEAEFGTKQFQALLFDVVDGEAIEKAVKIVADKVGKAGLAGLVNNAGIAVGGPLKHVSIEEWKKQFDVNVFGLMEVTKAFFPLLGADKNSPYPPGRIVNISSVAGRSAMPFMGPYSASKYAVEALSDAMRRELMDYGMDVVVIEPGPIQSEIWNKGMDEMDAFEGTDFEDRLYVFGKIVKKSKENALPAIEVAKVVHKGLTLAKPKTRYVVTADKMRFYMTNLLPDRTLDGLINKMLRRKKK